MARSVDCEGFRRRDFLKMGTAGLFGLGLPQLLKMEARAKEAGATSNRKAESVILVWLARRRAASA